MSGVKTKPIEGLRCAADMSPDELKRVPGSRVAIFGHKSIPDGSEGMAGDFRPGGGLLRGDGFWVHLDDDYINDAGKPSHRKPFVLKRIYLA